ncbi:MAG: hypothetical protein ACRDSF_24375, partial [Pseudonocardiaceae bacterium]
MGSAVDAAVLGPLAGDRDRVLRRAARRDPAADRRAGRATLEWPEGPPEAYDARRDRWTSTYGDGAGLILYTVVREQRRVLI